MPQQATITTQGRSGRPLAWTCLGAGVVLFLGGLLFGVGSWFYWQMQAHERIETMPAPTPRDLAAGMQQANVGGIAGLVVAALGFALIVLAVIWLGWRSEGDER
jgi:TRAP-type C4-dicarboxylate transport system permease small subunit